MSTNSLIIFVVFANKHPTPFHFGQGKKVLSCHFLCNQFSLRLSLNNWVLREKEKRRNDGGYVFFHQSECCVGCVWWWPSKLTQIFHVSIIWANELVRFERESSPSQFSSMEKSVVWCVPGVRRTYFFWRELRKFTRCAQQSQTIVILF